MDQKRNAVGNATHPASQVGRKRRRRWAARCAVGLLVLLSLCTQSQAVAQPLSNKDTGPAAAPTQAQGVGETGTLAPDDSSEERDTAGDGRTVAAPAANAAQPGAEKPAQPQHPWLARLEHRIERPKAQDRTLYSEERGSGTVIGPHTILTHGHYAPLGSESYSSESMALCFAATACLIRYHVQMTGLGMPYADDSVTLLVLPESIHLPKAVELGDPALLEAGDAVTVLYWDQDSERFAALETTITRIEDGITTVADPERVIGPGDSGSGMYNAQGQLVGNVWSVVNTRSGERLPYIQVGLLPAGIEEHIS